jgi:hypothetical protein
MTEVLPHALRSSTQDSLTVLENHYSLHPRVPEDHNFLPTM